MRFVATGCFVHHEITRICRVGCYNGS